MPELVNIGVVDDGSPAMGEVLNLLTRQNLLYKVVKEPGPGFDVNVQLGTPDFPAEAAANPYEFAARVRAKLGDDKRFVRLYGTSTVIARLTGDPKHARLYLLSFGSRRQENAGSQAIRVRVVSRSALRSPPTACRTRPSSAISETLTIRPSSGFPTSESAPSSISSRSNGM